MLIEKPLQKEVVGRESNKVRGPDHWDVITSLKLKSRPDSSHPSTRLAVALALISFAQTVCTLTFTDFQHFHGFYSNRARRCRPHFRSKRARRRTTQPQSSLLRHKHSSQQAHATREARAMLGSRGGCCG